jgi:hypothetical protein
MLRSAAALVLLLSCFCLGAHAFTWSACDADKVPFVPDNVLLVPDPPAAGGQVTFNIQGNAVHDVPAGQISIDVSFAGTPIYEEVDDLCSKTSCPIKTGPLDIKYIQDLPPIAPPGEYDVRVIARDIAGTELMCVDVHFEMLPPSFVQKFLPGSWLGKTKGSQSQRISEAGPAIARRMLQALRGN